MGQQMIDRDALGNLGGVVRQVGADRCIVGHLARFNKLGNCHRRKHLASRSDRKAGCQLVWNGLLLVRQAVSTLKHRRAVFGHQHDA